MGNAYQEDVTSSIVLCTSESAVASRYEYSSLLRHSVGYIVFAQLLQNVEYWHELILILCATDVKIVFYFLSGSLCNNKIET